MSVDIFGRGIGGELSQTVNKVIRGPPGVGFKYTADEQYDVERKRLCNVAEPVNDEDAVNLRKLRSELSELEQMIKALEQRVTEELPSRDLDAEGNKNLHDSHAEKILKLDQRLSELESQQRREQQ